ncbi:Cell division cycle protein 20-like [Holothuria leucospilota]|uniref:Cell division cycle protein 20-like n=1 Tax=Holothuria leucospilota TaxID=206669 RepID=A0A9Q1BPT0_HOLLE|nr:Cell division cycle protein 20-like [Holothuria leucospilota]
MAHFQLEAELQDVMKLDSVPARGPIPRWQRKTADQRNRKVSIDASVIWSPQNIRKKVFSQSGTPSKSMLKKTDVLTPKKTPKKAPAKGTTNGSASPTKDVKNQGDRFIPNRALMDLDLSHFKVTHDEDQDEENIEENEDEGDNYKRAISERLNMAQQKDCKILAFKQQVPKAEEGFYNRNKVLYSSSKNAPSKTKGTRSIPQTAERILDAPELLDDFYLTLVDWSSQNILAVALRQAVYLWNANSKEIDHLLTLPGEDEYVSSVSWISEGNILAVGNSSGQVQLWDVETSKCLRNMEGHSGRVGALDWNYYIVTSGAGTGQIHHHDVRVADHHVATLENHTQQVCGLEWSPDGSYLASGGNDNVLNVWDASTSTGMAPLHSLTHHQAAVKAVSWCPWQTHLLSSGGGTADRMLRFWAVNTGTCLKTVDTGSQVSSILWSKEYREIISGHGFSQNQLTIWKYPSMDRVTNLKGHTNRVLTMCLSPDGETVASAAGDETLRFWHCFAQDTKKKTAKSVAAGEKKPRSLIAGKIR